MVSEIALERPSYGVVVGAIASREPSEEYEALDPATAQRHRYAPSAFLLTLSVLAHAFGAGGTSRLFFYGGRRLFCRYILSHLGSDCRLDPPHPFDDEKNTKTSPLWEPRRAALRPTARSARTAPALVAATVLALADHISRRAGPLSRYFRLVPGALFGPHRAWATMRRGPWQLRRYGPETCGTTSWLSGSFRILHYVSDLIF
jgi:hypothetical protein